MTSSPTAARVALVTGAARGIGAATVEALCAQGYQVMALDSGNDTEPPPGVRYPLGRAEDLRALEQRYPGQVVTDLVDVRDAAALARAAQNAKDRFGRIDATVAAAAVIVGGSPLWTTPESHLRTLLDVDVVGVWNTAATTVPHMLAGPAPAGCRFVALASAAGSDGLFHLAAYSAAKHAVIGLVRGLAEDLVGTGVTAVAVSPGSTRTAMLQATADLYNIDDIEHFADSQLLRRVLEPSEIAATVAFCCSVNGAVLNGSVIAATGGFSA